ncbi:unnamed protein product [Arctia plantaginis]|uniref:Uncharacterized protein n=1 Tax=Arctia plantaginis TaxID=874455 RepID=A0A8S0ZXD3_ARCPL|nr:unnamed protein product [Arctia plantaginis]
MTIQLQIRSEILLEHNLVDRYHLNNHFICPVVSYVTLLEPTTRFNKVNIDLKTYIDIDEEEKDADLKLSIKNQKLKGDVKFIIGNNRNLRREFAGKRNKRFTEFIQNAVVTLQKYNDRNLKYFWTIFDEEIKKYHYRNCKFFELTGNPAINKLIAHKLQTMKDDSADTIRSNLAAISNNIENYNHDKSKAKLIDLINALYSNTDVSKFKRFLLNIETFYIYNGKVNNLRKIIQEGIRTIIFDHYSELHKAARQEVKYRIEEYFQNILKPSTTLLAQITNSMFLDFHVSGEKNKREFTTKSKREKLRVNKHNHKYNQTKSRQTKKENIESVKRKTKNIKTHKMERTIIKSELQFDEMFSLGTITQTKRRKNERKKKEQDTRILKNTRRSSEEKELTHSKLITDRTNRQTSKWHFTQSPTKNILRTLSNENIEIKTTSKKAKKSSSKFGSIEIVTMRPFSLKKTTSFGNIHYMIELDKNTETTRDLSALRAKVVKYQTKIPGILFGKIGIRKRVIDVIKEVTVRSTQQNLASVKPIFRFAVQKPPIVRNKNIQFEDESTVGFYRRRVLNQGNEISVTKLTTVSPYTNGVNPSEGTKNLRNGYHDSKSTKETVSFLRNTDYIKETTQEKERNTVNLRINVDDYIKRISTTRTEINENTKNILESMKSTYGKKILNDRPYYSDSFIRGKMDPGAEYSEFKIPNIVSSSVKTPITYTNFIRREKDSKSTHYSTRNVKANDMPHLNSINNENTNIDVEFVKNKKTEVNSNNKKALENAASKQGNLNEKKDKSEMINYRKGANQGSHNYYENFNNGNDFKRKEINEMYGLDTATDKTDNVRKHNLPPKGLRQSFSEQVEEETDRVFNNDKFKNKSVTKNLNKKEIDLEEYQAKELNGQVKNKDEEVLLNYNSQFTIESIKNNTLLSASNMADIAEETKISTNQDVTTRKSQWSKIKNYALKNFTDEYDKANTFDDERSHSKELDIDSDKVKPQNDLGTIKILNPSKEVTASDLEKMEPIARKQEELTLLREMERKTKRQVKLDRNTTVAGTFGWRRFWNNPYKDLFDEEQTETTRQMEDHTYQLVPQPKDPNIYLYMKNY